MLEYVLKKFTTESTHIKYASHKLHTMMWKEFWIHLLYTMLRTVNPNIQLHTFTSKKFTLRLSVWLNFLWHVSHWHMWTKYLHCVTSAAWVKKNSLNSLHQYCLSPVNINTIIQFICCTIIHRVKWRQSTNLQSFYFYVVRQHGVLCAVVWWRFVALFE